MEATGKKKQIKDRLALHRKEGKTIGLVPTMGCLHKGHISLIKKAKKECDIVVLSVFVNPIQFGPTEDYLEYPRDLRRDKAIAERQGVDYVFCPSNPQMYAPDHKTAVAVLQMQDMMCGKTRKDHFQGVCTVVAKLFHIIEPDRSYFGLKDYQQYAILKKMVKDLDMRTVLRGVQTVREKDGLALSSRNKYLSKEERKNATVLYETLKEAKDKLIGSKEGIGEIRRKALEKVQDSPFVKKIDYFDIRDADSLLEISKTEKGQKVLIAAAVWIGKTRLIDNILVRV